MAPLPTPAASPEIAATEPERSHTRRFFDRSVWAFPVIERVVLPEYRDVLARVRLPTTYRALDLGTGTGMLAQAFWERGHPVTGFDLSSRLLQRARKRLPALRFEQRDLAALDDLPDRAFDVVAMGYVLHGMSPPLRRHALRVASRLAARAVLLIDYARAGNWLTRIIERVEGPHYVEFLRSPLRDTLHTCGLHIVERARTRTGGGYWLCVPADLVGETGR